MKKFTWPQILKKLEKRGNKSVWRLANELFAKGSPRGVHGYPFRSEHSLASVLYAASKKPKKTPKPKKPSTWGTNKTQYTRRAKNRYETQLEGSFRRDW